LAYRLPSAGPLALAAKPPPRTKVWVAPTTDLQRDEEARPRRAPLYTHARANASIVL